MNSHLMEKARNIVVTITLRSDKHPFTGKIVEADDRFAVVIVKVNEKSGDVARSREEFEQAADGWRTDRLLVNVEDISTIL